MKLSPDYRYVTAAMKTPDDLEEGMSVLITETRNGATIEVNRKMNTDLERLIPQFHEAGLEVNINDLVSNKMRVTTQTDRGPKTREMAIGVYLQQQAKRDPKFQKLFSDYTNMKGGRGSSLRLVRGFVVDLGDWYTVHNQAASPGSGWGPFVYDLSIEYATLNGSYIVPATGAGAGAGGNSTMSRRVWKYYYENRPDVGKEPIDDAEDYYDEPDPKYNYKEVPWLFQKYTKSPVLISQLEAMNRSRPGTFVFEKSQQPAMVASRGRISL